MPLKETIVKATKIAGGQKALAELLGATQGNISDFKTGKRPCGPKKRAHLAAIANENPGIAVLEGIAELMNDDIPHEAETKKGILGAIEILASLQAQTKKRTHESQNIKLRTSQRYCFKTGYSPVFFCPLFSARSRRMTILLTPNSAATRV